MSADASRKPWANLVGVNGWERRRGVVYLDECERTWLQGSRRGWSLEVSWLTKALGIGVEVTGGSAEG